MESDMVDDNDDIKELSGGKLALWLAWIAVRLILVLLLIKKGTPFFYQGF